MPGETRWSAIGGPKGDPARTQARQEETELLTGRQTHMQSQNALQSQESFVLPIIAQKRKEEDGGRLAQERWRH